MEKAINVLVIHLVLLSAAGGAVVDFEEFSGVYNGSDGAGGFSSHGVRFNNSYTDYGGGMYSWSGWAVSDCTDTVTPGYMNQYSAFAGSGCSGSSCYGVGYLDAYFGGIPRIELPSGVFIESMMVTNTTYTALSMLNGDGYAKKFGGLDGTDEDYLKLIVNGYDRVGNSIGKIECFLADYRFADPVDDYILDEWICVDLSPLAFAATLEFEFDSSDVGAYGINTPTYLAIDDVVFLPEPSVWISLACSIVLVYSKRQGHADA